MSDRRICRKCERNLAQKGKLLCRACVGQGRLPSGKFAYRRSKKDVCEACGFEPEHLCQLDVDHADGNHDNNDPANHITICANCHRLKTHLNEDYRNIKHRSKNE